MKQIAIDARMLNHPGIGRYLASLLEALLPEAGACRVTLLGDPNRLRRFEENFGARIRRCDAPIYGIQEQLTLHRYFQDFDLVHVPHFNTPLRAHPRLVVTIHDLIYFHVADYQPFPGAAVLLKMKLRKIARDAKRIIAVSQATAKECAERFPDMKDRIRVIHEAAAPFFTAATGKTEASKVREKYALSKDFLLAVGSIREHKNIQGLLETYARLCRRGRTDADLVLVGRLDRRFDQKHGFHRRLRETPGLRYLGNVEDSELQALYQEAACFVMPSFYEGFGLPAIEAMASGAPVVASRTSSLPEVVGDAALLFDPGQIDQLTNLLYNVLSNKELRKELSTKARRQSSCFSWHKAARETLAVYEEVLRS